MDLGLAGSAFLVTGGSRGLGRAGAQALREEGADVVVSARTEADVEQAARELGGVGVAAELGPQGVRALVPVDGGAMRAL